MNTLLSRLTIACLLAALALSPAHAAGKKNKGQNKSQRDATASLSKKIQKADLPADVRDKASKVVAEYTPKIREAEKAREAVLTAEQKAARAAAQKEGKQAGKKRKEIAADVTAALKLTDDQKAKYNAAEKDLAAAQTEMQKALRNVLSADQQAAVGLKSRKKKNA